MNYLSVKINWSLMKLLIDKANLPLIAALQIVETCSDQVSLDDRVTPRYLTDGLGEMI